MPVKKAKKAVKRKAKPAKKAKRPAPKKKKAAPKARKPAAKKAKRVSAAPAPAPVLPWREPLAGETKIGVVDDYFAHIGVIAFVLEQPLAVGDKVHVRGHTTDLAVAVDSIQVNHQSLPRAEAGAAVGVKVGERCRKGDYVYRVTA